MGLIYLIRHGEPASGWGEAGGSPDPGLTERGEGQARAAAEHLLAGAPAPWPTHILSSPMRRCRETAAPLSARTGLAVAVEPAVAEVPTPPGISGPDRAAWLRAAMAEDWSDVEGIDGLAWRKSVVEVLLKAEGAAVFTHFVAINAAVSAAIETSSVLACRPAPGSVTTLYVEGGRLHLQGLGAELEGPGRVL